MMTDKLPIQTVGELITELQRYDPEQPVFVSLVGPDDVEPVLINTIDEDDNIVDLIVYLDR